LSIVPEWRGGGEPFFELFKRHVATPPGPAALPPHPEEGPRGVGSTVHTIEPPRGQEGDNPRRVPPLAGPRRPPHPRHYSRSPGASARGPGAPPPAPPRGRAGPPPPRCCRSTPASTTSCSARAPTCRSPATTSARSSRAS